MGRLQLDAARVEEIRRALLQRPDTGAGHQGRTPGKVRFVAAPVDAAGLGGLIDLISEKKLIGWFVSQVMKASQGKANPGLVNRILKQKLS